jgi:predicted protein tyrosine phosphatase
MSKIIVCMKKTKKKKIRKKKKEKEKEKRKEACLSIQNSEIIS